MEQGFFTISTRVYLTEKQRDKLKNLIQEREIELPDLLTELLVNFLEHQPDLRQLAHNAASQEGETIGDLSDQEEAIRKRREELYRLKKRANFDQNVPRWLKSYIEDLEREIEHMEKNLRSGRSGRRPA
jgi:hypothetical protein